MLPNPRLGVTDGWLPYVLPSDARTFRTQDERLASVLADAGGELVGHEPDVEIGRHLRGDARLGVVEFGYSRSESLRPRAAADRLARSLQVRLRARLARRAVARAYPEVSVVSWDVGYELPPSPVARRLARRVLVIGRRGQPVPSLLDAVFADARVEPAPALVREGLVVVPTGDAVLRCAVGPGRRELVSQQRALAALSSLQPPDEVRTLVPWLERSGRTGLADWTVEPRLPGAVRGDLPQRARQRCLDVLAGLRALDAGNATSAATDARAIVALVPTAGLEALGASVDAALVDHPRSFAHGDFWAGNVLVDGEGDVRGIIDWASAGPGRPALLDLLHLLLISERRPPGHAWGPAIVETLLPLARTEDETVASFARRVGVELDARRFLALVGAYWLDRLRYQLESFGDRVERPTWLRNNLTLVLRELAPLV